MADNIGQVSIGADLDLEGLQESFTRLENALNDLGGKFDGINADMNRSEESAKSMSFAFLKFTAASAAIYGLAKTSPQLSAALAEMQIGLMEVSYSLGEALEPAANTATQAMGEFAVWLRDNQDLVDGLGSAINDTLVLSINAIEGAWGALENLGIPDALKWLLDNFGPETLIGGLAAKFLGGTAGAAAFVGVEAVGAVSEKDWTEVGAIAGGIVGGLTGGVFGFGGGAVPGTALGAAGGAAFGDLLERLISESAKNSNTKSITLNSSDSFL